MLTPAFQLDQNNDNVFLTINAPYTNIKDCDIYVYENEVKFFSKPYFLRLNLPGNVIENGDATAKYDADCGVFKLILPKETPGEYFPDLDLLTKLLAPKVKPEQQPFIENIDEAPDEVIDDDDGDIWQVKQIPFEEVSLEGRKYGFNRMKTAVIGRMQDDLPNICDIKDPEQKSVEQARAERLEREKEHFNEEHYIDDYLDTEGEIAGKLEKDHLDFSKGPEFDERERLLLSTLPVRNYIMNKDDKRRCLLGLVDLIFAWSYNNRVCDGDWHPESGWTVAKLSATLSYFEEFHSMKAVKLSCLRRALIYPLFRHFNLALESWREAAAIFRAGPSFVLKCLLDIHRALEQDTDGRYILNQLYITDYMIWLQRQCKPQRLTEIAEMIENVEVTKEELCLDLSSLEEAANMVKIEQDMEEMSVNENYPSSKAPMVDAMQVAAISAQDIHLSDVLDSDDESSSQKDEND